LRGRALGSAGASVIAGASVAAGASVIAGAWVAAGAAGASVGAGVPQAANSMLRAIKIDKTIDKRFIFILLIRIGCGIFFHEACYILLRMTGFVSDGVRCLLGSGRPLFEQKIVWASLFFGGYLLVEWGSKYRLGKTQK
jgi:hypothetical protein